MKAQSPLGRGVYGPDFRHVNEGRDGNDRTATRGALASRRRVSAPVPNRPFASETLALPGNPPANDSFRYA